MEEGDKCSAPLRSGGAGCSNDSDGTQLTVENLASETILAVFDAVEGARPKLLRTLLCGLFDQSQSGAVCAWGYIQTWEALMAQEAKQKVSARLQSEGPFWRHSRSRRPHYWRRDGASRSSGSSDRFGRRFSNQTATVCGVSHRSHLDSQRLRQTSELPCNSTIFYSRCRVLWLSESTGVVQLRDNVLGRTGRKGASVPPPRRSVSGGRFGSTPSIVLSIFCSSA